MCRNTIAYDMLLLQAGLFITTTDWHGTWRQTGEYGHYGGGGIHLFLDPRDLVHEPMGDIPIIYRYVAGDNRLQDPQPMHTTRWRYYNMQMHKTDDISPSQSSENITRYFLDQYGQHL